MPVMRIGMINVLPLLVSPFEMINIPIGFSPLNFCILDFCSFNVTATGSFWDNLRRTEYVQHQKKYFKTVTPPFGRVQL